MNNSNAQITKLNPSEEILSGARTLASYFPAECTTAAERIEYLRSFTGSQAAETIESLAISIFAETISAQPHSPTDVSAAQEFMLESSALVKRLRREVIEAESRHREYDSY